MYAIESKRQLIIGMLSLLFYAVTPECRERKRFAAS